jgi:hypothetical protein
MNAVGMLFKWATDVAGFAGAVSYYPGRRGGQQAATIVAVIAAPDFL